MGGQNGYRVNITFDEWMREIEKRLIHEERRPLIRNAADIMGPGLAPFSVETQDWSGSETGFNGFFFSRPGALNSPDGTQHWIGQTQGTAEGAGYELVHQFDPVTGAISDQTMIRYFYTTGAGQKIFTDWTTFGEGGGGGTGGPPTGPAGGDLTGTYPNPQIANGAVDWANLSSVTQSQIQNFAPDAQDEGTDVVSNPIAFNFIGAGVTVDQSPTGVARVNIPGGGGSGGGDNEVVIGGPPPVVVGGEPELWVDTSSAMGAGLWYLHTQTVAANPWTVIHNLGRSPLSVTVIDSGNTQVLADVHYIDANSTTLNFGSATSGKAYLI